MSTDPLNPVWAGVVGQDVACALLERSAADPVHAYLFAGPAGTGKRAAARAFAALLLSPDGDGSGRDARLALAGEHPDVREVARTGPAITVEQASEIVRLAALAPTEGRRKVMIFEEFHLIRPEAAAKLLKTIEEPPASTVFLVLAEQITPELVTIASRCMKVDFRPLTDDVIVASLVESGVAETTAVEAARAASGSLDRARLLASDPGLSARRRLFADAPTRLDGTGAVAVNLVDELLATIDAAAEPLKARHVAETAALDERVASTGERGAGRKGLEERQKRELRRHRTDEIRSGLGVLAGSYRDALAGGEAHHAPSLVEAVHEIHRAIESLERNPNETLLLQALLLKLPSLA